MPLIIISLSVFILYFLQAVVYRRFWNRSLELSVVFQPVPCIEGEDGCLTETIVNQKFLPLPTLQVKFKINGSLDFKTMENTVITDNTYRNDIFSVMSYEKITRRHIFHCRQRGLYHIDEITILSNDLFLSHKMVNVNPIRTSIYVYPRPVSAGLLAIPFERMLGTVLTKRYHTEDPFEFRGIRPYQTYDSMKEINWKASAKTGALMVNTHNVTASQQVTIFLNMNSDTNWRYDDLAEESIRLAASYAERLIAQGIVTELVTNGYDSMTDQHLRLQGGAGKHHITAIKEGLSRLDISRDTDSFLPYVEAALSKPDNADTLYIMISRIQPTALIEAFSGLCSVSRGSQWICPLHIDMPFVLNRYRQIDAYRWDVPF